MEWIESLFVTHSAVQTIVVLSLIVSIGLALGKIHIKGISLGVAFVFFIGIVAGSMHFTADAQMLTFAETLGLSLFVYALGLHVGPNFIGMMRHEGVSLNLWGLGIILLGTAMALSLCLVLPIKYPRWWAFCVVPPLIHRLLVPRSRLLPTPISRAAVQHWDVP